MPEIHMCPQCQRQAHLNPQPADGLSYWTCPIHGMLRVDDMQQTPLHRWPLCPNDLKPVRFIPYEERMARFGVNTPAAEMHFWVCPGCGETYRGLKELAEFPVNWPDEVQ